MLAVTACSLPRWAGTYAYRGACTCMGAKGLA